MVFFDDILFFSKSYKEHLKHVREVLALLRADKWKVKMSKCAFAQQQIGYLGHTITAQGVATDPSKIQTVEQ